uniref:Tripartite motif containing 66 n=1 Tax=Seriola lalandi dorsalis TaxID=1841481 RepID=A0A3B4XLP4_SERLL
LCQSCSECSEPTLAQSLCTLCNKWLCYQCTDVHQHAPTAEAQCPGSYPCSLLMCHSHRQEPLELFCESCDLLCCSSCHLSSHKNHRSVLRYIALQDQQWLFESLMVQVEERRSAVENNAKKIEGRLHGVKIAHRKAENQIKMAKMIMMNELNKRANLLIEQLEKISEDFQQGLEDQLQGAIEICSQLDHVQKFITWATTHHCRGPVLFSRALISLQMQQLLEPSLHSDSWNPVKIKFNWDASFWMKQISSLGHLTVEGGNCTYPQGFACSSIMRPQPITCLALPPVFHRGREPGCGYQSCCEPQMCCLHGIPSQPDRPGLDKSQVEATLYNPSCVQPALISASLHQSQQLQRCWDTESSMHCPQPTSPVTIIGPIQLNCSRGSTSQPQAADSQPHSQSKSYLSHHPHQREILSDSQAQLSADRSRPGRCQGKLSISTGLQQELDDAETESDIQLEYDPSYQAETDSNVASDQPPDSQGSVESELDVDSEPELATDDPQPLRSDLEEEPHIGPVQRSLLIANPAPLRGPDEVQPGQDSAEMESEDFCAVCLIGGDLLCCDRCPKVFHLSCHIPSLLSFPSGDWVCSLCRDLVQPEVEYDCENERTSGEHKLAHGLSAYDQRKCERLTLLILSNILSAPFHEPVSPLARHYYQIIKRPMDLSVIRAKLNKRNTRHYNSPDQFVADVCLMFRNCAKFNYPDSEVAQAGRSLEAFFTSKLKEVFPDRVFPAAEADSDSDEYDEAYRTAESGFPWPERREQCHRKRKRRHSLKSRRHHF